MHVLAYNTETIILKQNFSLISQSSFETYIFCEHKVCPWGAFQINYIFVTIIITNKSSLHNDC